MLVAVQWRGGQSQPFGAARHSRVIDRLHIDLVTVQQLVASGLAEVGIADHHWDNVARRRHHWQISLGEATISARGPHLVVIAFGLARFKMADAGERARGNGWR